MERLIGGVDDERVRADRFLRRGTAVDLFDLSRARGDPLPIRVHGVCAAACEPIRSFSFGDGPAVTDEISKLHVRIRELEDELASVRAEAVEAVEFWGEFASNYSKAHHGLQADIKSLRGEMKTPGGITAGR